MRLVWWLGSPWQCHGLPHLPEARISSPWSPGPRISSAAYLVMLRSDRSTTNPSAETFSLQRSMPPGLSALPHRSKNRTTSSAVGREERGRSRVILKQYLNNNAQIHALQPRPGPSDECIPNQATLAHPRILTHRR